MFDFTDAVTPRSRAHVTTAAGKRAVTLSATDDVGLAGIEYATFPTGSGTPPRYRRYVGRVQLKRHWTLVWRAVDVNGNSEPLRRRDG
jgi:hypothetical protein